MSTILLVFALNSVGQIDRATPTNGHSVGAYDATQPTVKRHGAASKLARNWYDHRPNGKLFVTDEGASPTIHVVKKGW